MAGWRGYRLPVAALLLLLAFLALSATYLIFGQPQVACMTNKTEGHACGRVDRQPCMLFQSVYSGVLRRQRRALSLALSNITTAEVDAPSGTGERQGLPETLALWFSGLAYLNPSVSNPGSARHEPKQARLHQHKIESLLDSTNQNLRPISGTSLDTWLHITSAGLHSG